MFSVQLSKPTFINLKIRDYIKESTNKYLEKYLNKSTNFKSTNFKSTNTNYINKLCPWYSNHGIVYDSNDKINLDKIAIIIPLISFFSFLAGYHFSKLTE